MEATCLLRLTLRAQPRSGIYEMNSSHIVVPGVDLSSAFAYFAIHEISHFRARRVCYFDPQKKTVFSPRSRAFTESMTLDHSSPAIHVFANGLAVYRHHLIPAQLDRYARVNLHEPEEEEWFVRILGSLRSKRPIFFDVGAAIGYYTILARRIVPAVVVHAFEPLELHRRHLSANLMLNGIDPAGVLIHNEAVSDREGQAQFVASDFSSALLPEPRASPPGVTGKIFGWFKKAGSASQPSPPALAHQATSVATITLDAVLARLGSPVDLVKVDVQGFELDVLKGSTAALESKAIKNWLIGSHSSERHKACLAFLKERDYKIVFEELETQEQPDGIIIGQVA